MPERLPTPARRFVRSGAAAAIHRHIRPACAALALLAPPAAAQPGPARDTLTIGITQFPSTLHPNIESMVAKSYVLGFARRPLTAHDADWRVTCLLCEQLPSFANGLAARETTPDGKPGLRVTWRLREGLRWGDGTPITSDDLRFAWEAGRDPATGFGGAEFYRQAYALEVVDARTIALRLDRVNFQFDSAGDFQPLPAHLERERWSDDPRGYRNRTRYDTESAHPGLWSGPYRVTGVQPGAAVTLERNATWSGAAPAFRRIAVRAVENTAALEAQLLSGGVDMVAGELGLPVEQAVALERRANARFRFAYRPGLIYEHLDVRHDHPALGDVRVRRALLHATDRAQIVARLFEGRQTVADSSVSPLDPMHDGAVRRWDYDPVAAATLLDEAGWPRGADGVRRNAAGERLSLELVTTAGNRAREAVAQVLQGAWRSAGIELRVRAEPPRVLFGETLSKRRFAGLALFAWVSAPEGVPRTTLHAEEVPAEASNWAGQNYGGWRDADFDALLEALPQELDADRRRAGFARLQALYAERLPALPLWFRADAHVWPLWLDGVRPTGNLNPSSLWVEQWRVR